MYIMLDVDHIYPGLLNVIVYWHTFHLTLLKFNFYNIILSGSTGQGNFDLHNYINITINYLLLTLWCKEIPR